MTANFSFLLQLLIQNQYSLDSQPSQPNLPVISSPNENLISDIDFEDGRDLNIFEEDTCFNKWKSHFLQEKKLEKRNALKCQRWLWPDRTIPYKVELKNPSIIEKFQRAVREINDLGCVNFVQVDADQDWDLNLDHLIETFGLDERIRNLDQIKKDPKKKKSINQPIPKKKKLLLVQEIEPKPGRSCQATLGSIGRRPHLDLSPVCTKGQILHELMHVLGFAHEHQRPDRDRYVKIRCDHLMPNVSQDFRRLRSSVVNQLIQEDPYDFRSIMHYRLDHFSIDGEMTLVPLDMDYLRGREIKLEEIGNMRELSSGDIRRIRKLYQC